MADIRSDDSWRDVDALNGASFMTRERLDAIKRILRHPDISLYTMNAPQNSLNGVTPLGMAAWLDVPDAVKMLLEESADAVAVDGMDNHGATALMCKTYFRGSCAERGMNFLIL